MSSRSIEPFSAGSAFAQHAYVATFEVTAALNTRRAYWNDVRRWLQFCQERGVDPHGMPEREAYDPLPIAVTAWAEQMRLEGLAPKTRARRLAALSSVYARLRRKGVVKKNYFSVEEGPVREAALPITPTPVASPEAVRAVLNTCDDSPEGVRDTAIIRVLWATGARRASLTQMTFERLRADRDGFIATLIAKGSKEVRVLISGQAARALERWLAWLRSQRITTGPIWRAAAGAALDEKKIWQLLRRRAKVAGVEDRITPHTFRVAFLTFNPASLEAKQNAVGHADPATTRLYDRQAWRGREAFEAMPEIEDL